MGFFGGNIYYIRQGRFSQRWSEPLSARACLPTHHPASRKVRMSVSQERNAQTLPTSTALAAITQARCGWTPNTRDHPLTAEKNATK